MPYFTSAQNKQLVGLLLKLPNITDSSTREVLVTGLPRALQNQLPKSTVTYTDIQRMVDTLESDGAQLGDGTWPIVRVIERAIDLVDGLYLGTQLKQLVESASQESVSAQPQPDIGKSKNTGEDLESLRTILREKRRRLNALQLQQARYGISTEPHILIEIEDLKKEIAGLEVQV
jgi:hypothetical protein